MFLRNFKTKAAFLGEEIFKEARKPVGPLSMVIERGGD